MLHAVAGGLVALTVASGRADDRPPIVVDCASRPRNALRDAVARANRQGGGVIEVRAGECVEDISNPDHPGSRVTFRSIRLGDDVTIRGEGPTSVIRCVVRDQSRPHDRPVPCRDVAEGGGPGPAASNFLEASGGPGRPVRNLELADLAIVDAFRAVSIRHAERVTLTGLTVRDFGADGVLLRSVKDAVVRDGTFEGRNDRNPAAGWALSDGITVSSDRDPTKPFDCDTVGAAGTTTWVSDRIEIAGNVVRNVAAACIQAAATHHVRIVGNRVERCSDPRPQPEIVGSWGGVRLTNCTAHALVAHNTITRAGRGVMLLFVRDVEVRNNVIRDALDQGVLVAGKESVAGSRSRDVQIVDNTIDGTGRRPGGSSWPRAVRIVGEGPDVVVRGNRIGAAREGTARDVGRAVGGFLRDVLGGIAR